MNNSPILLSISMLVSGREEMKKSLDSLLYFKNAFPTEIILVDTGCSPEQRALAEKYADKIIDFTWCNDFAAARNAGLREAHGEWFMYLDDDEWFENPQEIIHFFTSDEHRHYNCASYVVRNYFNLTGTIYNDSYPTRMVRLEKETKFIGRIHEYLNPFISPKKIFSDYVHHYGYAYKNEADRKKRATRNSLLLHEMIKDYPGDPRWSCQLAQEYYADGKYEETIQTCENGLKEWRDKKDTLSYAPAHVGALYGYLLFSLELLKRYEEEESWLEKAFNDSVVKYKYMEPTVAFYWQAGARLYSALNQYERCTEYLERYLSYVKRLKDDRTILEAGAALIVANVFQDRFLYGTILTCLEATIRTENYKLAEEAFFTIDWSDRRLLYQRDYERKILDACCSVAYHPLWVKMLQTLVDKEEGIHEMYVIFVEQEIEYKKSVDERLLRFYRLVATLAFEHPYILNCRILWTGQNPEIGTEEERKHQLLELYAELFEKYPEQLFETKAQVWNVAEAMGLSLEPYLLRLDYRLWRHMLERWSREASYHKLEEWNNRVSTWKNSENIRYDIFFFMCSKGYLRHYNEIGTQEEQRLEQMEQLLWKYADNALKYYGGIYREEVFRDNPIILPDDAQLGLELKGLQECRQDGGDAEALSQLRRCIGICQELEEVIEFYAGLFRTMLERREKETKAAQTELEQVVQGLKLMARQRMQEGDFQTAVMILRQVIQCVPDDLEAQDMLTKIQSD